jgi:hypothetical protein
MTPTSGAFSALESFSGVNNTVEKLLTGVNDTSKPCLADVDDSAKFWPCSVNGTDRTYQLLNLPDTEPL